MNGIFISYRRDDSAGHAGRIHDRLVEHYGRHRVFRDVEDIGVGENFVEVLEDALAKCDVVVVVIGPNWVSATDATARRRLEDPDDVLRLEVASALERPGIKVVPLLVNGAAMPNAAELPENIRELATRNALEVRDTRFEDDVTHLIGAIGGKKAKRWRRLARAGGLVAVAAAAALAAFLVLAGGPQVAAEITLYQGDGELSRADSAAIVESEPSDTAPQPALENRAAGATDLYGIDYRYERSGDGAVRIASVFPYRELLLGGGPVMGGGARIAWDWPRLSVKVVNETDRPLYLSEVRMAVERSEVDTEPIVMVRERLNSTTFGMVNYGWGDIVDPSMRIAVVDVEECADTAWRDRRLIPFESQAFPEPWEPGEEVTFDVGDRVRAALENEPERVELGNARACAVGVLDYRTEGGDSRSLRFKTRIMLWGQEIAAAIVASAEYYVFLEAGKSDHVVSRSIDIAVPANGYAHFLLRLGTDRSAKFDLDVDLTAVNGDTIPAGRVELEILTPVYDHDNSRDPRLHR